MWEGLINGYNVFNPAGRGSLLFSTVPFKGTLTCCRLFLWWNCTFFLNNDNHAFFHIHYIDIFCPIMVSIYTSHPIFPWHPIAPLIGLLPFPLLSILFFFHSCSFILSAAAYRVNPVCRFIFVLDTLQVVPSLVTVFPSTFLIFHIHEKFWRSPQFCVTFPWGVGLSGWQLNVCFYSPWFQGFCWVRKDSFEGKHFEMF